MSLRVLVIPEDPTYNGYILRPVVAAILSDIGKPNARVMVLSKPRMRGFDDAVMKLRSELAERYRQHDIWLFMPDADRATPQVMTNLERELSEAGVTLFCCPAKPEVEIFLAWRFETGWATHGSRSVTAQT